MFTFRDSLPTRGRLLGRDAAGVFAPAFRSALAADAQTASISSLFGTELGVGPWSGRAAGAFLASEEITVYKAMGHIAEDAAAAALV